MSAQQSMALAYGKIHIDARTAFPKLTWAAGVNISCRLGDIHPCSGPSHWVNWAEILPLNLPVSHLSSWQSASKPGFPSNSNWSRKVSRLTIPMAILHCTRSKNLFRVTLFPFGGENLSHISYFLAYRGSASVSGPRLPPNCDEDFK